MEKRVEHFQILEPIAFLYGFNDLILNDNGYWYWELNYKMRSWLQPVLFKFFFDILRAFNINDPFKDTPEFRVSTGYTLLNWAGYHADDFTKDNGKKDRFKASSNDMQHAVSAIRSAVLVTNDTGLLRKAPVCYSYANIDTIVCNPTQFLSMCKIA